jgi:hypothetical protein
LTEYKTKLDLPPPRPRTQSQIDRDEALLFAHGGPFTRSEPPSGKHFVRVADLVVRDIVPRENPREKEDDR